MSVNLDLLRSKKSTRAVYPAPRYAFDAFDHGINRRTIVEDPDHAVFFAGPFGDLQPGDVFVLFFGDDLIPVMEMPLPGGPTGEIEIHAPAAQMLRHVPDNQARRLDIWYAIVRPLEAVESVRLLGYLIDFQPPGGIPVFGDPTYVNTRLAPIPELEAGIPQNQPLVMNVPPWENMSLGDRLFVRWGSASLGPFEITTTSQIGSAVPVTVSWETISGTDGGVARVDYYITDVVNNHSYYAQAKVIDAGVPLLPRPIFPDHFNGIIDLDFLGAANVPVIVAFDMRTTDQIRLIVERVTGDGMPLPQHAQAFSGDASGAVRVEIPHAIVKAIPGGELRARYEVTRAGSPLLRSQVTTASVKGTGAVLEPADTPEFPTHQIEVGRLAPDGLRVDIPRYAFLQPSNRIVVTSTFTKGGATYTDTQTRLGSDFGAASLTLRVPIERIVPAAGGTGTIVYSVLPDGQPSILAPVRNLTLLGAAPGEWDLEYNFDADRVRYVLPRQTIRFPETGLLVMDMQFDPDKHIDPNEQLGVELYRFNPTAEFRGSVLYVGNPQWVSHDNVFFVNFTEDWNVVRFAITSVDREVTVTFKDARLNIISGVITVPGGNNERQLEVRYNDNGRRRIRHLEIRCKDVIRIDSFKFRR
ncbi:hypothetical protein [Luteibacter sp.]|jgi:hypothetical protein|uniref:hypothetical protein n=1 Tax=Luteibacter sp. TaxID=1886636 RepID=UPI002F4260B3